MRHSSTNFDDLNGSDTDCGSNHGTCSPSAYLHISPRHEIVTFEHALNPGASQSSRLCDHTISHAIPKREEEGDEEAV